jgi:hypothetical protein
MHGLTGLRAGRKVSSRNDEKPTRQQPLTMRHISMLAHATGRRQQLKVRPVMPRSGLGKVHEFGQAGDIVDADWSANSNRFRSVHPAASRQTASMLWPSGSRTKAAK